MEIKLINDNLLSELHQKAKGNERIRMNYDLRTTPEDTFTADVECFGTWYARSYSSPSENK